MLSHKQLELKRLHLSSLSNVASTCSAALWSGHGSGDMVGAGAGVLLATAPGSPLAVSKGMVLSSAILHIRLRLKHLFERKKIPSLKKPMLEKFCV